jgi:hypothetical protein
LSTETLNFLIIRKDLISLIILAENSNFEKICTIGQGATLYQRHFDIQEDHSRSHIIVEI